MDQQEIHSATQTNIPATEADNQDVNTCIRPVHSFI